MKIKNTFFYPQIVSIGNNDKTKSQKKKEKKSEKKEKAKTTQMKKFYRFCARVLLSYIENEFLSTSTQSSFSKKITFFGNIDISVKERFLCLLLDSSDFQFILQKTVNLIFKTRLNTNICHFFFYLTLSPLFSFRFFPFSLSTSSHIDFSRVLSRVSFFSFLSLFSCLCGAFSICNSFP